MSTISTRIHALSSKSAVLSSLKLLMGSQTGAPKKFRCFAFLAAPPNLPSTLSGPARKGVRNPFD
jgi:hypothetical protein